jgi:sucrose-6-phosphatase
MTIPPLLATDLDRTLIPNGRAPESPNARPLFSAFVERRKPALVYVTGRRLELVRDAIASFALPLPDRIVADVGSSIWRPEGSSWVRTKGWDEGLAEDWPGGGGGERVALFAEDRELTPQAAVAQSAFKLSFTTDPDIDEEALGERMRARLLEEGLRSTIVFSIDEEQGIGLVDALPARSSKRHAIEYLLRESGLTPDRSLFAGDSGNDLEVLVSPLPSVLVGNATEELRVRVVAEAARRGNASALHLARGGVLDLNGNYAAGILEGWWHFHPEDRTLLEELAG